MAELEKRTILVLTTHHLTYDTADLLDKPVSEWPCVGGPYSDYGYFVYAHDENDGSIPADLFSVMEFARKNACDNILFDRDAEEVEGLPLYDW